MQGSLTRADPYNIKSNLLDLNVHGYKKMWQKRGKEEVNQANLLIYKKKCGGPDGTRIFVWCFGVCTGVVKFLIFKIIFHCRALVNTAVLLKLDRKLDKFKARTSKLLGLKSPKANVQKTMS